MKRNVLAALALLFSMQTAVLKANNVYPLPVFTDNGDYSGILDLDMYVEVTSAGSMVDFEFFNDSLVDSVIARIYFDDNEMLSFESIINGPGTSFSTPATPPVLPAGQELVMPFEVDFSVGANPPGPQNGINNPDGSLPNDSLTVRFDLIGGATFASVNDALESSDLRIGIHVIALPDGSSEAAVTPEPATLLLLSFGAVMLRKKRAA